MNFPPGLCSPANRPLSNEAAGELAGGSDQWCCCTGLCSAMHRGWNAASSATLLAKAAALGGLGTGHRAVANKQWTTKKAVLYALPFIILAQQGRDASL